MRLPRQSYQLGGIWHHLQGRGLLTQLFDLRTRVFEQRRSVHICFSLAGHLKMTLGTLIKSLMMIASCRSNTPRVFQQIKVIIVAAYLSASGNG